MDYEEIVNDYLIKEKKKSKKIIKCIFCHQPFPYYKTFGQLECLTHPGGFDFQKNTYKCCGLEEHFKGCTSCDHSEDLVYENDFKSVIYKAYEEKLYLEPATADAYAKIINDVKYAFIRVCCNKKEKIK